MNKFLYAGVALCTLVAATSGFAADLPSRVAPAAPGPIYTPPPVFTWTGFYAGINGGYDFGKVTSPSALFGTTSGGTIGGTLGYNYQVNQLVLGVEGDLDWMDAHRTLTFAGPITTTATVHALGTARVRLGYAADRTLFYVTGGYAGGSLNVGIVDAPTGTAYTSNSYRNGWAVGGGVEYALTNQISAKAEYLYAALPNKSVFGAPNTTLTGYNVSTIRAGLNYHF